MPTTDAQVNQKRVDVEKLREEISSANAEIARRQRELDNDNTMAGLDSEEGRLKLELADRKKVLESLEGSRAKQLALEESAVPAAPPVPTQAPTKTATDGSTNGKG
jgi:predicted RNase H-like nuclease (RuvC/YqgF family)